MAYSLVSFVIDKRRSVVESKDLSSSERGEPFATVRLGRLNCEVEVLFKSDSQRECQEQLWTMESRLGRNSTGFQPRAIRRPIKRGRSNSPENNEQRSVPVVNQKVRNGDTQQQLQNDDHFDTFPQFIDEQPHAVMEEIPSSPQSTHSSVHPPDVKPTVLPAASGCCNCRAETQGLIQVVAKLSSAIDDLRHEIRKMRKHTGEEAPEHVIRLDDQPSVMYEGVDLSKLNGCTPSRYGASLVRALFTPEELTQWQISPQKKKGREAAPEDRVMLMKAAIRGRFGDDPDVWEQARKSANQVGLDSRKNAAVDLKVEMQSSMSREVESSIVDHVQEMSAVNL